MRISDSPYDSVFYYSLNYEAVIENDVSCQ